MMKDNGTYCPLIFNEIYADSSGEYRLCCHARTTTVSRKYKSQTHKPFEYFNSPEMEEKRNAVLCGEKLPECIKCYTMEESTGTSYRTKALKKLKNKMPPLSVDKVTLKLRINGTFCNLSCYMCIPYNSSTRRNEMNKIYPEGWDFFSESDYVSVKSKEWYLIVNDIIDNIERVDTIHITGGEPLQLPKHWEMLDLISEEHAKNIELQYDTNFTELRYKNHSVWDIENKFKRIHWGISCDHYGKKLEYIRYPIDIKKFEANLRETKDFQTRNLNCTTSLLNVEDLISIKDYYKQNFNIEVKFTSVVMTPKILSIRNLPEEKKQQLINRYEHIPEFAYVLSELKKEGNSTDLKAGIEYMKKLSKQRNMNHAELWPQYDN